MTNKKILWGFLIIIFGILLLLQNLSIITISWHYIFKLWPIFLILLGISILQVSDKVKLIATVITLILGLILYIYQAGTGRNGKFHCKRKHKTEIKRYNKDKHDESEYEIKEEDYALYDEDSLISEGDVSLMCDEYDTLTKNVEFEMNFASGDFNIHSIKDNSNLICFNNPSDMHNYSLSSKGSVNKELELNLLTEDFKFNKFNSYDNSEYNFDMQLHTSPTWDLNITAAAAEIELDGSDLKIKKLEIEGGAYNANIKIGNKQEDVNIEVGSAAAKTTIHIPKDAYCEIDTEGTILNTKDFDGFIKSEKKYTRNNKTDSACKIYIKIESALSSLKIKTY